MQQLILSKEKDSKQLNDEIAFLKKQINELKAFIHTSKMKDDPNSTYCTTHSILLNLSYIIELKSIYVHDMINFKTIKQILNSEESRRPREQ